MIPLVYLKVEVSEVVGLRLNILICGSIHMVTGYMHICGIIYSNLKMYPLGSHKMGIFSLNAHTLQ